MTKEQAFYQRLADVVIETETIDLEEDTNGFKNIHEVTAYIMLKDELQATIIDNLKPYACMIKRNIHRAIDYIKNDLKRPVYIVRGFEVQNDEDDEVGFRHTKNITLITTDENYKNARYNNYRRRAKWLASTLENFNAFQKIEYPDKPQVGKTIEKRLTSDAYDPIQA